MDETKYQQQNNSKIFMVDLLIIFAVTKRAPFNNSFEIAFYLFENGLHLFEIEFKLFEIGPQTFEIGVKLFEIELKLFEYDLQLFEIGPKKV